MPVKAPEKASRWRRRGPELAGFLGAVVAVVVIGLVVVLNAKPAPAPAIPPCTIDNSDLPPLSSPNATLTYVPGSANTLTEGRYTTSTFQVLVNETTKLALPNVSATFVVTPIKMPASYSGGPACTISLPTDEWTASPSSLRLDPGQSATESLSASPDVPYAQAGAFVVEVQDEQVTPVGLGGATYVVLTVSG